MQTKAIVVDDDQRSCEMVRTILESSGMSVDIQTRSGEASKRLQAERFDLILLDVRMPVPDGFAVLRLLRNSGVNRRSVVVLMTGDTTPKVMAEGFEAGANFFLFKPVDANRLLRLILTSEAAIFREKRRYQRVPLRCPMTVRTTRETFAASTLDIILGGVLMQAIRSLPLYEFVGMEIRLESGKSVCLGGRVVRTHEEGCMGVEFQNVPPKEAERLQDFLLPLILRAFELVQDTP